MFGLFSKTIRYESIRVLFRGPVCEISRDRTGCTGRQRTSRYDRGDQGVGWMGYDPKQIVLRGGPTRGGLVWFRVGIHIINPQWVNVGLYSPRLTQP